MTQRVFFAAFQHACLQFSLSSAFAAFAAISLFAPRDCRGQTPPPVVATLDTSDAATPDALFTAPASFKTPVVINGRTYVRPTAREQFRDYLNDTYGLPGAARTAARALYAQGMSKPSAWGEDWPGFGQRFGSAGAVTVIDGNVRYGMEMLFKEDMRYIPCHGCSVKRKVENALLAEITARHDTDGHRFFTLTPTVTDMSGPLIANSIWVPGHTAIDGFVGSRLIFATRIGGHLFSEFVLERRHHDPKLPD